MYRGTTPTNIFNVDLDISDAEVIYITYKQDDTVVLEKTLSDITVEPKRLTVVLTQDDTLKLAPGRVEIQIRARFRDSAAVASNIIKTTAEQILKEGRI